MASAVSWHWHWHAICTSVIECASVPHDVCCDGLELTNHHTLGTERAAFDVPHAWLMQDVVTVVLCACMGVHQDSTPAC